MFDRPQILPDRSPVCLSFQPTTVGQTQTQVVLLENQGKEQLVIGDVHIEEDLRDHLSVEGVAPKNVNTFDFAHVQLKYAPSSTASAAGWDLAYLEIQSNAENYGSLRIPILALAAPENPPVDWDPGPKPAEALSGEEEMCKNDFKPRM